MRPMTVNPEITHPAAHDGSRDPSVVMARDQTSAGEHPFGAKEPYPDGTVCSECGAMVRNRHWTLNPEQARALLAAGTPQQVVCPACRTEREQLPRGVVTLHGGYWAAHRDEIVNLIRNQEAEAQRDNPLERLLSLREEDGCLVLETTNEKLAQKIGRSLLKAHDGELRYQWPEGNHLVRVEWERSR